MVSFYNSFTVRNFVLSYGKSEHKFTNSNNLGYKTERESVISKDMPRLVNRNNLRRSLEPLRIDNNLSDTDTSEDSPNEVTYAKLSRTGYIPL